MSTVQADHGERRAQKIIDHLPVTVYRTTPDGRILEGNRAVENLLGYSVEEFISMHTDDLYFDPEDRNPFLKECIDDGVDVVRTVLRLKRKDGAQVWVEDVGRAVLDDEGNVKYFDGTLVDITDHVEAEQELRDNEAMLRTIHDKAPIAIFNMDPVGKVFQANPQAHAMLGLEEGGLLGKTIAEFTFPDDAQESQDAFMRLKSGETDEVSLDKRYRRVDGKAIWGHVRAVAIRAPDGSFSHTISLVQDITQRKRTEEAFRLLDRLTHQVNEAVDLEEALKAVLDSICESIGFPYGEAWMPTPEGRLALSPAWHGAQSLEFMKFRRLSEKMELGPGDGVPGRTMDLDEALWVENLSHGQENIRAAAASAAGLHCALSVPVRNRDELVAVLVFMDTDRETPQGHTLRLVKFLADRLGSSVARRRLEILLADQAHIMQAQIEGASEAIMVLSGTGHIRMVNHRFLDLCGVDTGASHDAASSMKWLNELRDDREFLERVHWAMESQTDGRGCIGLDGVLYERRSIRLQDDTTGRVWYFRKIGPTDQAG